MAVHSLPLQTHPGTADFTSGFDESCNKGFWASIAGAHLYPPRQCSARLRTGYLVMDFIEPQQGSMLRNKWPTADPDRRQNLFRTLANILLDLMKVPLPRIGSFTVLDTGEVTLTGRPLTAALALLEAEEIPSDMPPGTTYPSTDSYVEDLLHCHETRLQDQPNAVEEENEEIPLVLRRCVASSTRIRLLGRSHSANIRAFTYRRHRSSRDLPKYVSPLLRPKRLEACRAQNRGKGEIRSGFTRIG
jgi:hypothetical protein